MKGLARRPCALEMLTIAPPALRVHARQRGADQQEGRLEHEAHDQAEGLGVELLDRADPLDAGVVDEDVDVEREVVQRRGVGQVDDPRLAADGLGRGIRRLGVQVGDDDVRAATGELVRARESDAARAAGDQGAPAREVLLGHSASPLRPAGRSARRERVVDEAHHVVEHLRLEHRRRRAGGVALPQQEAHADELAHSHERPRRDFGVERAVDVADVLRSAQARLVALDDARVVQAEGLGRDELRLAHDAVEGRVLGGEAEEAREARALRLQPRGRAGHRLRHRVPHAPVEVDHESLEDRLLAVEVEVERAEADAGALGDLDDRRLVVALLGEHDLRSLEQAPAGGLTALGERAARGGRDQFGLTLEHVIGNGHTAHLPLFAGRDRAGGTVRASRSSSAAATRRTPRARGP